ncbi:SpoIIE family protein phosphatase [Streptomyces sp. SS]|uniref:SpoIIE family protein phosphatase n=1 Tax=Streptomyces sp. SS TaxID=260742 RepID=UPI0002F0ECD5|nr:SpoIIE family protein phosphatase [Streptomyces sp. SS]
MDAEQPLVTVDEKTWGEAVLGAVFTQAQVGLHVLDRDLRVIKVNKVAAGVRGIPAERIVGLPAAEAYATLGVSYDEGVLLDVLATGRPATGRLVTGLPLPGTHRPPVFSVSVHRLEDTDGKVLGLVVTSTDVTDRERARARLDLLHDAHERIGTGLDVERTARELVDVTLPGFADSVVVALTDAVLRGKDPALESADTAPLLRCAAAGRTAAGPPVPDVGPVLLPGVFGDALPTEAALLPAEPTAGGHPAGPALVAPLSVHGQVLGAVAFHRGQGAEPYGRDDLALAAALATRTATCLENALRFTREHIVMYALQSWPLRQHEATQRAVDVAQRHRPGGTGAGSWYDVIPLPGARVALVAGQVENPGLSAVATMSRLRTAVHSLSTLDLDPHELLARLHTTTRRLSGEQSDASAFGSAADEPTASCTIAVYDPAVGRLDVARAGTSLFAVVRPDGSVDDRPVEDGPLLGAEGPPFACATHELPEGSTICLASAPPPGDEGARPDGVMAALSRPDRDPQAMADDLERLLAPDRVLLLARTRRLSADELAAWEIPFDFAEVGTARTLVEDRIAQWGLALDPFAVTLVASELVTNAIRYGSAPITLRLMKEGPGLVCEVSDAGQAAPHLRHAKAVDEGGRGLLICASIADDWGVRYTDDGKSVWAEIGTKAPSPR